MGSYEADSGEGTRGGRQASLGDGSPAVPLPSLSQEAGPMNTPRPSQMRRPLHGSEAGKQKPNHRGRWLTAGVVIGSLATTAAGVTLYRALHTSGSRPDQVQARSFVLKEVKDAQTSCLPAHVGKLIISSNARILTTPSLLANNANRDSGLVRPGNQDYVPGAIMVASGSTQYYQFHAAEHRLTGSTDTDGLARDLRYVVVGESGVQVDATSNAVACTTFDDSGNAMLRDGSRTAYSNIINDGDAAKVQSFEQTEADLARLTAQ